MKNIKNKNYIIYNKSGKYISHITDNYISINNFGYNICSYLKFIISNYDDLPNVAIFCKENIFTRHISIEMFLKLIERKCFTNLDNNKTNNIFPISLNVSNNSYVEINNSWYKFDLPRKYFSEYNDIYSLFI